MLKFPVLAAAGVWLWCWLMVDYLAPQGSDGDDIDDISEGHAETLPLCSRLQTPQKSSGLRRPIPVDDLWTYLTHQKIVGCRDLKAEYGVCLLIHWSNITWNKIYYVLYCFFQFMMYMSSVQCLSKIQVLVKLICLQIWSAGLYVASSMRCVSNFNYLRAFLEPKVAVMADLHY